jgi:arginase family enzyme
MHAMPGVVEKLATALPQVPLTVYLGGDNAITRPLVRGLSADLSRTGLITFDAHHDVRTLTMGPTNGTPVRGLVEEDGLPGANIVQIGIHSFANSAEYRSYCDQKGISVLTVADVENRGVEVVVDSALTSLADRCDAIYVDVDIDVLDRSLAPACPGARPGGLGIRELAEGVRRCARSPLVRAVDYVEVDAEADRDGITLDALAHAFLAAAAGYAERP